LLDAALTHVPFDGWTESAFAAAAADLDLTVGEARMIAPRGPVGLAVAYHRRGDDAMVARLAEIGAMRYSEKVAALVRFRLEATPDKEVVRRGMALFALPQHAAEGAALIWGTADRIWTALGDTSDDINWYSKRAILSGVYGSTVLFWLGDKSEGDSATWAFLDRRIADVMRFEKFKGQVRANPALKPFLALPDAIFSRIKAPAPGRRPDLPGRWGRGL